MQAFVGGLIGAALVVAAVVAFMWWQRRQRALSDANARENADYYDAGQASGAVVPIVPLPGVIATIPAPLSPVSARSALRVEGMTVTA